MSRANDYMSQFYKALDQRNKKNTNTYTSGSNSYTAPQKSSGGGNDYMSQFYAALEQRAEEERKKRVEREAKKKAEEAKKAEEDKKKSEEAKKKSEEAKKKKEQEKNTESIRDRVKKEGAEAVGKQLLAQHSSRYGTPGASVAVIGAAPAPGQVAMIEAKNKLKEKAETDGSSVAKFFNNILATPEKYADKLAMAMWDDGYDVGDITRFLFANAGTIGEATLATGSDLLLNTGKGAFGLAEGISDFILYGGGMLTDAVGLDDAADFMRGSAKYDAAGAIFDPWINKADKMSVAGSTTDQLSQGVGQMMALGAAGKLAGTAVKSAQGLKTLDTATKAAKATRLATSATMFASSAGHGTSEAYNHANNVYRSSVAKAMEDGASPEEAIKIGIAESKNAVSDGEAYVYGLLSGTSETISEMLFSGMNKMIGLGSLTSLDDTLAKALTKKIQNKFAKTGVQLLIKSGAEGLEGYAAGWGNALSKKLTYMSEEDFWEILDDENLMEQFLTEMSVAALMQSGAVPGFSNGTAAEAIKTGRDMITGLNADEQAVIDHVVKATVEEKKQNGEKVKKSDVEAQVREAMEKGYIPVETIEEVLGGETYKTFTDTYEQEKTAYEELKELYEGEEGRQVLNSFMESSKLPELRNQLSQEVFNKVGNSYLAESYNQAAQRNKRFEADISKYDEKQRETIQRAIDSGVLNNSRRTHEFVDLLAGLEAQTGVAKYDFTNNQKLAETGYVIEGKTINGFENNGVVTINMNSPKYLNTVVGHETMHALEGTELGKAFSDMVVDWAKGKKASNSKFASEYHERLKDAYDLYRKVNGYEGAQGLEKIKKEVVADLVGDYIFTDTDFVQHLAKNNPKGFQKILERIKYLYKLATAGSKEARQLERLKNSFEQMFKTDVKVDTENDAKLSISDYEGNHLSDEQVEYFKDSQVRIGNSLMVVYHGTKRDFTVFDSTKGGYDSRSGGLMWAAKDKDYAEAFTTRYDPIVMRGYLNITKMLDIGDIDSYDSYDTRLKELADIVKLKPSQLEAMVDGEVEDIFDITSTKAFKDRIVELGYDGVVATESGRKTFGFVDSNQFKDINNKKPTADKDIRYSLSMVDAVRPTSDKWTSGATTDEVRAAHPTLYAVDEDATETRNPTQVKGTVGSYRTIYDILEGEGFNGTILDASSGLGYGTQAGIQEYGFNVEDIEPYPDKGYKPKYTDYSTLNKTYDVVISNAVLNVLPQDQRDALVVKMGELLNPGGRMFVNVRGKDVLNASGKIAINEANMEYFIPRTAKTGSYQKGFTKAELKAYLEDALGDGYTVTTTNKFGAVSAIVTKDRGVRFSLSEAVEETNNLMALHNLHTNELLKQLEMGGMVYPSVAVTDPAKIAHEDFGDITTILRKDAIDPKTSKYNHIYSSDAYTPTFPHVSYEANSKVAENVISRVKAQFDKLPDYYQRSLRSLRDETNLNDVLNRYGGFDGLVANYADDHGMKQLYLAEKGEAVPMVINRTETQLTDYQKALYQSLVDRIGEEEIRSLSDRGYFNTLGEARIAWTKEHLDVLKDIYADDWSSDGTITKAEAMDIANEQKLFYWYKEATSALEYLENGGLTVVEKEDLDATNAKVDEKIAGSDYKQWLNDLFSGIEGQSGIRNSKDTFLPSGKRRSFAQLHDPVTIDNVIKVMRKKDQTGLGAVGGNFNGAAVQEYSSIAEAKRNANMLGVIDETEYKDIKKSIDDKLFDISYRYANGKDIIDAKNAIIEAVAKNESKAGIARYLRQYDYVFQYTDEIGSDIIELRDYVRSLPRPYFEAKPRRAVGFDEVAVFVIPRNADVKLKQELLNKGYSIAEYDPDVEGDRQKVVNQFEEYKFSLSNAGETQKRYGNYHVSGSDLMYEGDDIAPVREDIAQAETAVTEVTEETEQGLPIREDIVPAQEELFPDEQSQDEEYEALDQRREEIESQFEEVIATEDWDTFQKLNDEYTQVRQRMSELETEMSERFDSITDEDAPPIVEQYDDPRADTIPLTKKAENDIARDLRAKLGLGNKNMADVHRIIQEYVNNEFPDAYHLFDEIKEKFGTYTESYDNEYLREAKNFIRTYGIKVPDYVKREIADYADVMRRNRGRIRFSNTGLDINEFYDKELKSKYPDLFPESIDNPTNQFNRIVDVVNTDSVKQEQRAVDDDAIWEAVNIITKGISQYRQNQKQVVSNKFARESFDSLVKENNPPPANYDHIINRKPVDTISNNPAVETHDAIPNKDVPEGQQALWEDNTPKVITRQELHEGILDNTRAKFAEKGLDFDEVLKNAKDLSTFSTVDNTPQRVMEKALGYKAGQILSDITVNKVAQNETEGIKWLNSYLDRKSGLLAKIANKYHIKPGSKESAAAQMYAEGFFVNGKNEIIRYGDPELAQDFRDAKTRENIKGLARDPRIRQIYDETLDMINESRKRNAYPEIPKLDNYYLHFRAMDDTFSKLGLPFNPNDIRAKDLPTDLNGVTADLKPGQPYFASAKHREGKRTSFDLLGGLERYLTSAKNQIYHIDDIQTLRALRNHIAETYGQAQGLEDLDLLDEEEAAQRIKDVYDSHLSTFAKFLNEEANVLAGKTALIDRGLEGIIGRRGLTFLKTINQQTGANMVGYNVSSSLTNLLAAVQGFAKTNKVDFVKGFAQFGANKFKSIFGKSDGFAKNSSVMIRRKGADRFHRTAWQKMSDPGYALMAAVDSVSTELIARAKYNEFIRKGMDAKQADIETDKWVSRLMGDRSLGQMPQLYNSATLGLITKFQLEVRNQLDSQFYDTIKEANASTEDIQNGLARNAKKAAKIASTFFQLAVGQHLFGMAFESIAGYNPAFDMIDVLSKMFGWDDDEDDEDTVLDNIEEGFLALMGDLPYTSTFTGGRIPISSALPIEQLVTGKDDYGNEKSRVDTLLEAAPYYLLPGGYGQIKKTATGLGMFDDDLPIAGSYTDNGAMRFPVEDTWQNRLQAGLFGQWANENARDYIDNQRKPLQEKQIQEFIDVDIPIADYWKYRDGLSGLTTIEEKADYINSLDLPIDKKNLLINNQTDRKDPIDLTDYDLYDSFEEFDYAQQNPEKYAFLEKEGIGYYGWKNLDEDTKASWSWAFTNQDEYEHYKANGIMPEDYRVYRVPMLDFKNESDKAYEWSYNYPEKAVVGKVFSDVAEYRQYATDLDDIRADKDANGKSISGSAKEKKHDYIWSLDIDEGAKYILFKSEYKSDDTYNRQIVEYLDSRADISWADMKSILEELDFTVYDDGRITWD